MSIQPCRPHNVVPSFSKYIKYRYGLVVETWTQELVPNTKKKYKRKKIEAKHSRTLGRSITPPYGWGHGRSVLRPDLGTHRTMVTLN